MPAFTGLGAPHWDSDARGTLVGITRGTERAHLVRATLEAIAYQTADLVTAMRGDANHAVRALRADGGAAFYQGAVKSIETGGPSHRARDPARQLRDV